VDKSTAQTGIAGNKTFVGLMTLAGAVVSDLTPGGVPYASTGGRLVTSPGLTLDATDRTLSVVSTSSGDAVLAADASGTDASHGAYIAASGNYAAGAVLTAAASGTNNKRWFFGTGLGTSDFVVQAQADSGAAAATPLRLSRSGSVAIGGGAAIAKTLRATATLDFPSTALGATSDLTISLTGAAVGDVVKLGTPVPAAGTFYVAFVSAADAVKVRFVNFAGGGAVDPASGTFAVDIEQ
jgi:hypothetical protein